MNFFRQPATVVATMLCASAFANQAHDIISAMPEAKRSEVLTGFMSKSGEPCKVERTFFQGFDKKDAAFWSVACSNKKSYSIMMSNDATGSTKVLDCKILKTVTKVECFKRF